MMKSSIIKLLIMAIILIASAAMNIHFYYAAHRAGISSLRSEADAKIAIAEGRHKDAIASAYEALSFGEDISISARLIGDAYYCLGKKDEAALNYYIAMKHSSSDGMKELLRDNIDAMAKGRALRGQGPSCHNQ